MSKFDELLEQLNAEQEQQDIMAKALPQQDSQDDEEIQAAAEDGKDEAEETTSEEAGSDDEESMTKSITLENGEEAIDATELLKSLQETQAEQGEALAKAMPQILGLMQGQREMIQQQGELIKSMQGRLEQLAGQGRGRKTVLTIAEKPVVGEDLAKSQPATIEPRQLLAKALSAQAEGKMTGLDVARIENAIQSGVPVNAELLSRLS